MSGEDHAFWAGDTESVVAEIEEFLTGARTASASDRILATILFTDIVGSTERARALGDRGWHELLEEHNARVRELLARFDGRELDTAGDGFFASFEGPGTAVRHRLRGIAEPWQLFAVDDDSRPAPAARLGGAREHMTPVDRAVVKVARRAPGVLRLGARLAGGRQR